MILFSALSMLPLLSLYVGAQMSSDASPACIHPPCKDSLVAAPIPPGTGGVSATSCEGHAGTNACRLGLLLPAISNVQKVDHRQDSSQLLFKVSAIPCWTSRVHTLQKKSGLFCPPHKSVIVSLRKATYCATLASTLSVRCFHWCPEPPAVYSHVPATVLSVLSWHRPEVFFLSRDTKLGTTQQSWSNNCQQSKQR